jgi:hypothetical protein
MLLGVWKNVEDLELNINLHELEAIIEAAREREHRRNKFFAALKGINLDAAQNEDVKDRFENVKLRAEARRTGQDPETLEYESLGLDVETD